MTVQVNIREAKTHLSRLLKRVAAGEDVVIANAGKPVARLIPYQPVLGPRIPGREAGRIWVADDFDDPLPDDLQALFEGEGDEVVG